jgi:hypothetical protein
MSSKEISNVKSNWKDANEYKKYLEGLFLRTECELRKELNVHQTGSTALAMKICQHKNHPYSHTQFPKKCTIEHCPLTGN